MHPSSFCLPAGDLAKNKDVTCLDRVKAQGGDDLAVGAAALDLSGFPGYRWETQEVNDLFPLTHHPYAYAIDDPIRYTDPTGKCILGVIVDTVICGEVALAVLAGLTAGGVVAANPDTRSAAQDVANGVATTVSNAITNVRTNMPRGWAYVTSGDWRPDQELSPLSAQEGKSVRLGPNLDESCPGGPGGFSLEQLDPYW